MKDPIIEEIHKIRYEIAKRNNFDPKKICDEAHETAKKFNPKYVSFPPKRISKKRDE